MREPTEQDHTCWRVAMDTFELGMTKATFKTWFSGIKLEGFEEDAVFLSVVNEYALDWLENRLFEQVARVCSAIWQTKLIPKFFIRRDAPVQLAFVAQTVDTQGTAVPQPDIGLPAFSWVGFEGLKNNYTQVPNQLIDEVIPFISPTVGILVLATFRNTVGRFIDASANREDEWATTNRHICVACNIGRSSVYAAIWDARAMGLLVYRRVEEAIERKHLCRKWQLSIDERQEVFTLRPRWTNEDPDYPDAPRPKR